MEAGAGFTSGQKVWVLTPDGGQRAATYRGESQNSYFGGQIMAIVVYDDDGEGAQVSLDMVLPRDD